MVAPCPTMFFFFKQKTAYERRISDWSSDVCSSDLRQRDLPMQGEEVLLFADTFNRYFEPDNLRDAETVLRRAGFAAVEALPADGGARPLCCGRRFLAAGLVEEAKAAMRQIGRGSGRERVCQYVSL